MGLRAMVIGASGQDGQILTARLKNMGWQTFKLDRPGTGENERALLQAQIETLGPDVIFNLAGFSSVWKSWLLPAATILGNTVQMAHLLEAHRASLSKARIITTNSSEAFDSSISPITEESASASKSPYAIAKLASASLAQIFRDVHGVDVRILHLFNHESPLRPEHFVSQKIAVGVAKIKLGLANELSLGNIEVSRDWGYAPDFVDAMIKVAELPEAEDFVVASGSLHKLTDLIGSAFQAVGISDWENFVVSETDNFRPNDHAGAWGDSAKLRKRTGWQPTKSAIETIEEMTHHQFLKLQRKTTDREWLERVTK
jgi:GDPmannose 4,6-dehydratase